MDQNNTELKVQMEEVEAYLRSKYPGHNFEVTGYTPLAGTARDYDEWFYNTLDAEGNAENESSFVAMGRINGDSYELTDDFYGELIRGEIVKKIRKAALEAGFPVIDIKASFWEQFGSDEAKDISALDVLTGKINAGNDIKIFLDGSALKQSSYENALVELEKVFSQKKFTGDYYVVILKDKDADPARDRLYSDSFTL